MNSVRHLTLVTKSNVTAPNPSAVEMARDLLAMCESGDIQTLVILGVGADSSVIDGWSAGDTLRPYTVIGALEKLKYEFMARHIESR